MLRSILSLAVVVALAASSQAATISFTSAPTDGLAGFSTYTFTASVPDPSDKIIGFDFVGGGGTYGISGALNQVVLFGGALPTIYADNNVAFGTTPVSQDSQFKVVSSTGLAINSSESTSSLKSAFNYLPAGVATATNSLAFVQLTTNDPGSIRGLGTITVQNAQGEARLETVNVAVPEPATVTMLGLALVGCIGFARRRAA